MAVLPGGKEEVERLGAVMDDLDPRARVALPERPHRKLDVKGIVLDEQDVDRRLILHKASSRS